MFCTKNLKSKKNHVYLYLYFSCKLCIIFKSHMVEKLELFLLVENSNTQQSISLERRFAQSHYDQTYQSTRTAFFFHFRLTLWCAWVWWWCCCLFGRSYLLEKLKAFDLSSVSCDDDDDESSQKQSLWVSKGQFVSRDTLHVSKLEFDCQTCWRKKACPLLVCGCC